MVLYLTIYSTVFLNKLSKNYCIIKLNSHKMNSCIIHKQSLKIVFRI